MRATPGQDGPCVRPFIWTRRLGQDSSRWVQPPRDGTSLRPGVISEQGLREEVPPVLQHHLLQVALELPACKFSWLKAQVGGGTASARHLRARWGFPAGQGPAGGPGG